MKKGVLLIQFLFFGIASLIAQNPYADIGKTTEVLTLSNGKYQEIIPNDTLVRIGSVLFNTQTEEIATFLPDDSTNTDGVVEADASSRFLSVDPIAREYPELTPYQFASNRPIDGIDLDGLEFTKPPVRGWDEWKILSEKIQIMTINNTKVEITLRAVEDAAHTKGAVFRSRNLETGYKSYYHFAANSNETQDPSYWTQFDPDAGQKAHVQAIDNFGVGMSAFVAAPVAVGAIAETGVIGLGMRSLGTYLSKNPDKLGGAISDLKTQFEFQLVQQQGDVSKAFGNINWISPVAQLIPINRYFAGAFVSSAVGNSISLTLNSGADAPIYSDFQTTARNIGLGFVGNMAGGINPIKGKFGTAGDFGVSFAVNNLSNTTVGLTQMFLDKYFPTRLK